MKNKNIVSKIVPAGLVVLALTFGGSYYYKTVYNQPQSAAVVEQKTIFYAGEDGKTVFDLLKEKYQVESTDSSMGVMINSINGLKATDKEFWLYSVNGQSGEVAADKFSTKTGDEIKWEYKGF